MAKAPKPENIGSFKQFNNNLNKDLKTSLRACSVICYGASMEVLEPAHLRKEIGEILKTLNKEYND